MPRIGRRALLWTLPAVLLLGGAGYAVWRWGGADWHYRAARAALEARDYDQAQADCDACLQVWPNSAAVRLLAGRCARHRGAFDDAESHLSAARRLNGDASALTLEWTLLEVQRGDGTAAEELYLSSLVDHDHPESPEILDALTQGGLVSYRLGDALASVERWLRLRPDDGQALYLRGLIREGMQQAAEALEDYRRAVACAPAHVAARKRLAEGLLADGQASAALDQFELLRKRTAEDPDVLLGAARCLRRLGRVEDAVRLLDGLASRASAGVACLRERGALALDRGDDAEAAGWFRKSLAVDPFDPEACYQLAQCLGRLDRGDEAKECLARARRIDEDVALLRTLTEQAGQRPDDPGPRCAAGIVCLRNGQTDEGLRWLRGALQQDPRHPPTHAALADYYESAGQPERAAEHRRFVLSSAP